MISVSDWLMLLDCASTSSSNRHFATIAIVRRVISSCMSRISPSFHSPSIAYCVGGHYISVSCNPRVAERGLYQPALPVMKFSLTRQEPLSEDFLRPLEEIPLDEILVLSNQNFLN